MFPEYCYDCGAIIDLLSHGDDCHYEGGHIRCDDCQQSHRKLQAHYYDLVPFCPVHQLSDYNHLRRANVQYEWANLSVFEQNVRNYEHRELKILTDRARKASRRP